jgi:hypothetical protein
MLGVLQSILKNLSSHWRGMLFVSNCREPGHCSQYQKGCHGEEAVELYFIDSKHRTRTSREADVIPRRRWTLTARATQLASIT